MSILLRAQDSTWHYLRSQPKLVTLATFNVGGYGIERRLGELARFFSTLEAGIVGLQEVPLKYWGPFAQHELEVLPGEPVGKDELCNAILYDREQYTLIDSRSLWLTETGEPGSGWGGYPRTVHIAMVRRTVSGIPLVIANTQLDNKKHRARQGGMDIILEIMRKVPRNIPQAIMGDMNMTVGLVHPKWPERKKKPYRDILAAGYTDTMLAAKPNTGRRFQTFQSFRPGVGGIDPHGLWDPDGLYTWRIKVGNLLPHRSYGATPASDHDALLLDGELQTRKDWLRVSDEKLGQIFASLF